MPCLPEAESQLTKQFTDGWPGPPELAHVNPTDADVTQGGPVYCKSRIGIEQGLRGHGTLKQLFLEKLLGGSFSWVW